MDLTRAIGYRSFALNSVAAQTGTGDMAGCEIVEVVHGGVLGVGYDEKRAMADGYDASDVFLGKRVEALRGNLYGLTRGDLYDRMAALTDILTPSDAYESDPANRGYHALDFYEPTADLVNHPAGIIRKIMYVRPSKQPVFRIGSDRQGGQDNLPLAIPWEVEVEAKDPRIYSYALNSQAIHVDTVASLTNLGNRPAPVVITINLSSGVSSGLVVFSGVGFGSLGIPITLTGANQTIVYNSHDKTLYLDGVLRMDLMDAQNHIYVPPGTGNLAIEMLDGAAFVSSSLVYRDTWA